MSPINFPDFSCPVYKPGDFDYDGYCYQYATTSEPMPMSPAAIICPQYPNADSDVKKAIQYAYNNNVSIAVRTGGHAYSGTSSTSAPNMQLDLSKAYNDWEDNGDGTFTMGISFSLAEFNTKLRASGHFMPTGQCYNVHLGGHVQTGGYGQLSRAFGLFSDHVESFEIYLAPKKQGEEPTKRTVKRGEELFFAVLGGGPGNYGIMTHITIRPLKDSDYPDARAYKHIIPYNPELDHNVLVDLFNLVKEWENAPSGYDFSITVASAEGNFLANQLGLASAEDFLVTFFGGKNSSPPFDVILVYFQYSNTDKSTQYDPSWCQKIKTILQKANTSGPICERIKMFEEQIILDLMIKQQDDKPVPISTSITEFWTYQGTREFNYPYIKNGQVTDSIASEDWAEWAAGRIDEMVGRSDEGLMVFVQCQNFGGAGSVYPNGWKNNAKNTSYAWRKTTVGYNLDVFYDPETSGAFQKANDWQNENIKWNVGANGKFSVENHRWFWASHGDLNMKNVWQYYYDSRDVYDTCRNVKNSVDSNGVFTPNSFVVGYDLNILDDSIPAHSRLEIKFNDAEMTEHHTETAKQRAKEKGVNLDNFFR